MRIPPLSSVFLGICLAGTSQAGPVTYTKDVAPILYKNCVECHRAGDIAPMSLFSYEETRPWAKSIQENVANRVMPPFHAETGKFAFANDRRLTDDEVATIVAWVEQGAVRGDPALMPQPPEFDPDGWKAGMPDLVLQPSAAYTVSGETNDEYRCYVLPTNLPKDTWISGVEYRPGNREVVHHIMAYAEPTHRARAKDEATPEPGFLCGMSGDQETLNFNLLLGGWAPGTPPNIFSEGVGRLLPAGTDIVFQVHYHNETGKDQADRSAMGIHFAKGPIRHKALISLVGAFVLNIPPGEPNAQHQGFWNAPSDLMLGSVMPHMHYLGKAMKVTAKFPDGRTETLLNVPRYDFNWQIVYEYEDPLFIPKGTQFHMVSLHDNTAENQYPTGRTPETVRWGEATNEEMAHAWLGFHKVDEDLNVTAEPPIMPQSTD